MNERAEGTRRRLYGAQDMVRISSSSCAGCGACCREMSDTIVLDPCDVWQLGIITGKTFEELMGAGIDLHVKEGVILPHLMMREETPSCSLLGGDGKCRVHPSRPGICRLFPLGRQFDDEKTSYFIVPQGCVKGGLSKSESTGGSVFPIFPHMRTTSRAGTCWSGPSGPESRQSRRRKCAETSTCIFSGCSLWRPMIQFLPQTPSIKKRRTE